MTCSNGSGSLNVTQKSLSNTRAYILIEALYNYSTSTRDGCFKPSYSISVMSQELVAVKFVFQVWMMVEGLPFHHSTQGCAHGLKMQLHISRARVRAVMWSAAGKSHDWNATTITVVQTWLPLQLSTVAGIQVNILKLKPPGCQWLYYNQNQNLQDLKIKTN